MLAGAHTSTEQMTYFTLGRRNSFAARCTAALLRLDGTTIAPPWYKASAMARPMPLVPPRITATFPVKSKQFSDCLDIEAPARTLFSTRSRSTCLICGRLGADGDRRCRVSDSLQQL